ncbi:MAG TPA: DUF4440 domain-containing protein [Syntrophomonadaceae bacterium]|nr:DUF4440 domain-containing protein [Syntrophomonadaceae bacterium]
MADLSSLTAQFQAFEKLLLQPGVRKSLQKLEDLIADDFVEFACSGRTYNKQQAIAVLQTTPAIHMEMNNLQVKMLASGIVLATYRLIHLNESGNKVKCSLRSSIWKLQDDKWQIVFHQGTPK